MQRCASRRVASATFAATPSTVGVACQSSLRRPSVAALTMASSGCGAAVPLMSSHRMHSTTQTVLCRSAGAPKTSQSSSGSFLAAATRPCEVSEVRELLLSVTRNASARHPMLASQALKGLPRAVQTQLEQYVSAERAAPSSSSPSPSPPHAKAGFLAYVRDHLSDCFAVESACLIPLSAPDARGARGFDAVSAGSAHAATMDSPSRPQPAHAGSASFSRGVSAGFRAASATAFRDLSPPPPPSPLSNAAAVRAGTQRGTASASSPSRTATASAEAASSQLGEEEQTRVPGNNVDAMAALVPYLPTFFVPADRVAETLPASLQHLYRGSTFFFYVKRFRYYVDVRIGRGGVPELRLKPGFSHPEAGAADARFQHSSFVSGSGRSGQAQHPLQDGEGPVPGRTHDASVMDTGEDNATTSRLRSGRGFANTVPEKNVFRPPARHSEAHLIALVLPHIPKAFTPLTDVLPEVSELVSRHPSFNALLGVTGFFCKYPEYFQLSYARIRVRPYRSAPNALDDLDRESSPFPEVMAKVCARCEAAALGKNYDDPAQFKAATVNTSKLYALLTAAEKEAVRQKCGSFPQFLRLHGHVLLVSPDNMRVCVFKPEHTKCADTILDARLQFGTGGGPGLAADDPIARIPESMPDDSAAERAVRELYDALPLTQCVPLDELLHLVPAHVSSALPDRVEEVASRLASHPQFFQLWPFPDNPAVTVVMRAQVEIPDLDHAELLRGVLALIPTQGGGTDKATLLARASSHLQRYLYRHGVNATLEKLGAHVAVSGDRVIRFERE